MLIFKSITMREFTIVATGMVMAAWTGAWEKMWWVLPYTFIFSAAIGKLNHDGTLSIPSRMDCMDPISKIQHLLQPLERFICGTILGWFLAPWWTSVLIIFGTIWSVADFNRSCQILMVVDTIIIEYLLASEDLWIAMCIHTFQIMARIIGFPTITNTFKFISKTRRGLKLKNCGRVI